MIGVLRGRDLERPELEQLALEIASKHETWEDLVHPDPEARTYEQLWRDEHVGIWVICWSRDHDTGFHDHDISSGAIAVARGNVREERLGIGGASVSRVLGPGEAVDFAASDIHRVLHAGEGPAVTINVYSPPLWRMGAYEVHPSGLLQRHSVSYAEELRPLEAAGG